MDKVQADTDLGNGWEAWELVDALKVHGLEYTMTQFDVQHLDNIPKLHNAILSLSAAINHFNQTLDQLGFNELDTEDF